MASAFGRIFSRSARGPLPATWKRKRRSAALGRPIALEVLEGRVLLTGTWTKLTNLAPSSTGIGTMLLLSDGTVLAQGGNIVNTWYELTPDASGSYVNGTWSTLPAMHHTRLYYGSSVLPDGRVFVVGGEYSDAGSETVTGEIYDPIANTWTDTANYPLTEFGDDPLEVLPDGTILGGYNQGPQTAIYNPATNAWTPGGTKLTNDSTSEESWVKLPDDSILSYDICVFNPSGCTAGAAQRYIPSSNSWVAAGMSPVQLSGSAYGWENGPAFLLPDGRAWFTGASGHTAFYTPSDNSWAAGPDLPMIGGRQLSAYDEPGAVLTNGKVLLSVGTLPVYGTPTYLLEFDPATNTYTNVTPSSSIIDTSGVAYADRMVVLPTGQVLLTTGSNDGQLAVYTPDGTFDASWKPAITSIADNGDGTFTLTGTQLNGINEGAAYGDDAQMASNYPIVQLTASDGTVIYARTYDWNATGVGPDNGATSVQFALPQGITPTNYSLVAIANGIASDPVNLVAGAGPAVLRSVPNGNTEPGVSSVRFTFNESILPRTFEDIAKSIDSFTDPNGNPIAVTSVTPVHGTHGRQFDVNFATQVQAGTYTLVIGPKIKDVMHRQMDQNGNGIAGEIPGDEYTATFTITSPQVVAYSPTGNNNLPGSVESVRFTFSRPIDPATFTPAQVDGFTDPNGNAIPVSAVTPVSGTSNTQYDVTFSPLGQAGSYSMVIDPGIADQYGNPLGQPYTAQFGITPPQVVGFESNGSNGVPPTSVRVTFNEPIDPRTFTTAQVTSFTDPNGNPVPVDSVAPVSGSNNTQFDIGFAPQTVVGDYSMTIGPDIFDLYGNSLPAAFTGTFTYTNNLLTNGGFETGDFTGWTQSGNTGATTVGTTDPHSGRYAADLGPFGSLGFLTQTVATAPGQSYTLIYWLAHPNGGTPNEFQVSIGGTMVYDQVNLGNFPYMEFTFTYTATAATTAIRFGFREDPAYFYLDDVSFSPSGTNTVIRDPSGNAPAPGNMMPLHPGKTAPSASSVAVVSGTSEAGQSRSPEPKVADSATTTNVVSADAAAYGLLAETDPMNAALLDNVFKEFA